MKVLQGKLTSPGATLRYLCWYRSVVEQHVDTVESNGEGWKRKVVASLVDDDDDDGVGKGSASDIRNGWSSATEIGLDGPCTEEDR